MKTPDDRGAGSHPASFWRVAPPGPLWRVGRRIQPARFGGFRFDFAGLAFGLSIASLVAVAAMVADATIIIIVLRTVAASVGHAFAMPTKSWSPRSEFDRISASAAARGAAIR
jgi:hypothetical protein